MNRPIPFTRNELQIVDTLPGFFGGPSSPVLNTPVSSRENVAAQFFEKAPYWLVLPSDGSLFFGPKFYNDLLGRGGPGGTKDAFGVEWEWVEVTGGSIVRPGTGVLLEDVNEWKDKVQFPDIDKWDWAGAAKESKIDTRFSSQFSFVNGFWFERLISFMEFTPAACALIDPDQQDAIKSLFEATTDFACKLVDKFCETWPALDGFNVHDDWGSQMAPFFSDEIARRLFLPYMKELTGHIHAKGRYATLHSCGHVESRVNIFIEAGFDQWDPQIMNDTHRLYEEVGDKIIISVVPEPFDPEKTGEAEQRQRARDHVDRFCKPGKPSQIGFYGSPALTPAFREEVYEYSRRCYAKM